MQRTDRNKFSIQSFRPVVNGFLRKFWKSYDKHIIRASEHQSIRKPGCGKFLRGSVVFRQEQDSRDLYQSRSPKRGMLSDIKSHTHVLHGVSHNVPQYPEKYFRETMACSENAWTAGTYFRGFGGPMPNARTLWYFVFMFEYSVSFGFPMLQGRDCTLFDKACSDFVERL